MFQTENVKISTLNKQKIWMNVIWVAAIIMSAFLYLGVSVGEILAGLPEFFKYFVENFLPPNYKNIHTYIPYVLDTIYFAIVGTYISAILAFVMGLCMSREYTPSKKLRVVMIAIASFFRNVPFLVWASLLIFIFGIGNMVGLMAITIVTLGSLSRFYAESFNEIPKERLESLRASGASYTQILFHGIIPEFIPAWINWTLFTFEINIRASSVLGMVGAGGIGIMIQTNMRLFKYQEAFALVSVLVAMVLLTEFVTGYLRKIVR